MLLIKCPKHHLGFQIGVGGLELLAHLALLLNVVTSAEPGGNLTIFATAGQDLAQKPTLKTVFGSEAVFYPATERTYDKKRQPPNRKNQSAHNDCTPG